jgi:hypothetical protein
MQTVACGRNGHQPTLGPQRAAAPRTAGTEEVRRERPSARRASGKHEGSDQNRAARHQVLGLRCVSCFFMRYRPSVLLGLQLLGQAPAPRGAACRPARSIRKDTFARMPHKTASTATGGCRRRASVKWAGGPSPPHASARLTPAPPDHVHHPQLQVSRSASAPEMAISLVSTNAASARSRRMPSDDASGCR